MVAIEPGRGVLLGRSASSPIATHPSVSNYVSAEHARVWVDADDPSTVYLADSSTNGTWLQGARLAPFVANVISVGDTIQLTRHNPVILEVLP